MALGTVLVVVTILCHQNMICHPSDETYHHLMAPLDKTEGHHPHTLWSLHDMGHNLVGETSPSTSQDHEVKEAEIV